MSVVPDCILLGDIGATNARLALLTNMVLGPIARFQVARFAQFTELLNLFLQEHRCENQPKWGVFAVAAPTDGGRCVFTNCAWVIDSVELETKFGFKSQLFNDFEAVAHSLPVLGPADLAQVGGGEANKTSPMVVLGPGTGLGVACRVARTDGAVVQSEGGHATLAATCNREDQIIQHLRRRFSHVSAERAVSGPGLENLYHAIGTLKKVTTPLKDAAEITNSALRGECSIAVEALNTFCAFLGSFAGNMALTFGARGGVYIAGGISPRIVDFLRKSHFRDRFESKGRFREYLKSIPVHVITHPDATFIGLKSLLAQDRKLQPKHERLV